MNDQAQKPERWNLDAIEERARNAETALMPAGMLSATNDIKALVAYVRALEAQAADSEKALAVLGATNARHTVTIQASEDTEDRLRRELSLSTARSFDLEAQLAEANAKRPCGEPEDGEPSEDSVLIGYKKCMAVIKGFGFRATTYESDEGGICACLINNDTDELIKETAEYDTRVHAINVAMRYAIGLGARSAEPVAMVKCPAKGDKKLPKIRHFDGGAS